jgi:hypothetical protein
VSLSNTLTIRIPKKISTQHEQHERGHGRSSLGTRRVRSEFDVVDVITDDEEGAGSFKQISSGPSFSAIHFSPACGAWHPPRPASATVRRARGYGK